MPIMTETDVRPDDDITWAAPSDAGAGIALAVLLPNDTDPDELVPHFARIALIGIPFPSFADGRGFSLAKRLRDLGYRGRLRARGHVIADQFRYALACGFDEVQIDDALAARQPASLWHRASDIAPAPFQRRSRTAQAAAEAQRAAADAALCFGHHY